MDDLMKALHTAERELEAATKEVRSARKRETVALNAYNDATKAIEKELQEMRKRAPQGTDWSRELSGAMATGASDG